uniref:Uncharacterized protein LOC104265552 n=1 Tax=Phallusia mammillata TaxID=59560 RepID=A0A6F9DIW0_9ASCI|nr:uncharacterized protein LOC104265552 [Phallusia mammillata]
MYAVVEFTQHDGECSVEIIPQLWLENDGQCCRWPPYQDNTKITKAVKNQINALPSWPKYGIERIMYQTDSYLKAREKLKLAEDFSDLQTDTDHTPKAKRKKRPIIRYDDEDTEDEVCSRPKKRSAPVVPLLRTSSAITESQLKEQLLNNEVFTSERHHIVSSDDTIEVSPSSSSIESTRRHKSKTASTQRTIERPYYTIPTTVEKKILASLEQIKLLIANNTSLIRSLANANSLSEVILPPGIELPLDNMETLNTVEELLSDCKTEKQLTSFLGGIGGKDVANTTRNIMRHLLGNTVAQQFNMKGKGSK